jgi:NADH-quinone oxidoreductase subunit L
MFPRLSDEPGLLYVVATLIPLASFVFILIAGGLKNLGRTYRSTDWGSTLYWLLGGDQVGKGGAYLATGAIATSAVLGIIGLGLFLREFPVVVVEHHGAHATEHHAAPHTDAKGHEEEDEPKAKDKAASKAEDKAKADEHAPAAATFTGNPPSSNAWAGRVTWTRLPPPPGVRAADDMRPGVKLELGYRIDHLAAVMFAMVTFVATLIHFFALGYMADEAEETVEDHQAIVHEETATGPHGDAARHEHFPHHDAAHFRRRGRYNRFFMFFSLFCFSMLNLVISDNLFQTFISWELVGVCSYLLIGYYYERTSAANAANKAFITNRVGDVGFIIGLMVIWFYVGTFNFQEVFARLRSPAADAHGPVELAGSIVRARPSGVVEAGKQTFHYTSRDEEPGSDAVLFPLQKADDHFHAIGKGEATIEIGAAPKLNEYSAMPYWLLVVAGLGVFLGCVGKSAQFPLQVWLPDAMEGPTPVSALVHSATMVAAGVYLVGRCFPLFAYEVLMTIAYTGAITLFVAATIAVVANDIKKVLAYSTISQLGFMMLALGIGGWVAGLLHLLTHAFFKALLFLCSGSVIYGCHHEQDLRKMGGLYPKMRVTALTMLVGCLAIAGTPLFSGWYSKDAILAQSIAFARYYPKHSLLMLLPLGTAGLTCFYMFRMWFMAFTGEPRDHHVYEHAHESPRLMTYPLVILAAFSVFVAWGWPLWKADQSYLGHLLENAQPASVTADFGGMLIAVHERLLPAYHSLAGALALGAALVGVIFAFVIYYLKRFDPADAVEQFPGVYRFLHNKWYFDEFYSAFVVRPSLAVAHWFRWFDSKVIDGILDGSATVTIKTAKGGGRFDNGIIDGLANLIARVVYAVGGWLRNVQTGYLRSYVLFLVLAAIGLFAALTYFVSLAAAR